MNDWAKQFTAVLAAVAGYGLLDRFVLSHAYDHLENLIEDLNGEEEEEK